MKLKLFAGIAVTLIIAACSDEGSSPSSSNGNLNANEGGVYTRLEFPRLIGGSVELVHFDSTATGGPQVNYSVEWDPVRRSQRWSCYQMFRGNTQQGTGVTRYRGQPQYPYDPLLPADTRFPYDPIWHSGYEHGHICPSADRLNTSNANYQTFFLTNMQPQLHVFNGYDRKQGWNGVWVTMENAVRSLVRDGGRWAWCDTLYVCRGGTIGTGGTLSDQIRERRTGGFIVPGYFFCALLRVKNGQYNAIGLLFKHEDNTDEDLANYAMSIDELESKTGLDFFCNLPDSRERVIETTFNTALWGF